MEKKGEEREKKKTRNKKGKIDWAEGTKERKKEKTYSNTWPIEL